MNEPVALPAPDQPERSADRPPQPPAAEPNRRGALPLLCAIGFFVLAAAIAYLWWNMVPPDQLASQTREIDVLSEHVAGLQTKLNQLSQLQSAVTPGDLAKLNARVDTLDGRLANQAQLATQVDAASGRIEALSGQIQTLSAQEKSALDAVRQQISDVSSRSAAAEASAANVQSFSGRLDRIAKLQEAAFALSLGQPVGDVPGAPPALARYAHTPPPTEAQIRQDYAKAQAAALAAQQPDNASAPLADRMWERAQGLITVRRGNQVVVGDNTSVALNQAQSALEAGDLQRAIKAVETLKGDPAAAMADWLAKAKGLMDARLALAQMADQA